ncbi:hypothetical protein APR12_004633 [Nocardia amikacinitolerans]|nr:hypothetical protein [Nocardia amikacinitolerans]
MSLLPALSRADRAEQPGIPHVRFHHLKWAGIGDVNFGLFTLVWDHLLHHYSYDPARRFTSDDLGMAAKPDYPVGYLAQLAEPFTRHGVCTTTSVEHAENRSDAASIGQAPPSRV